MQAPRTLVATGVAGNRRIQPFSPARTAAGNSRRWTSSFHIRESTVVAQATAPAAAEDVENVAIVGSGPAGYTAAIYTARANLKPVVFEGFQNGRGGQLMGTTEVENYPGFPEGVTGPELMDKMRAQAERWGAELHTEDVLHIDLSKRPFTIRSTEREVRAHSLIIATGATARRLTFPSENDFWGKGISACAICDGTSPLFKNKEVAVAGGGDSATEEAIYLTKYCSRVHLLVRGSKLRASQAMVDRTLANKLITVHYNTAVEDANGKKGGVLEELVLENKLSGEKWMLPVAGLFYGIGHSPNSKLIEGQVELDDFGYVKVHHGVSTSVPGVFAAGDLHDTEWRQAVTAAGSGCMAALSSERYLTANSLAIQHRSAAAPATAESTAAEAAASANGAAAAASAAEAQAEDAFDITRDKHKGQYALRKLYHETDRLLAVLYTSPSCGPCRTLKPIFNGVVDEFAGKVHFVEINIEEDPEIAEAAGVMGTPTVQFFKNKNRIHNLPGVKMKKEYRAIISANTAPAPALVSAV